MEVRAPTHYQGCGVSGVRQKASGTEGWCMAKAKKTKPRDNLIRWRVSLITATPAKFIDWAHPPRRGLRRARRTGSAKRACN
jgi:hypothetical protein